VTKWLDDEEMAAWRGLVETFADLNALLEAELVATHGITLAEYGTMVRLSEAEGRRLRMCDLAALLHLSASGLTRRVEDLVKRGWVRREPDPQDRRVINAVLTEEGFAVLAGAAPTHVEGVRRHLFDHLSRTQVRQLGSILRALERAADAGTAASPAG
jgi:DNA-binding MarR family transcriptional regulator